MFNLYYLYTSTGYLQHDEVQNLYSLGYIFREKNNLLKLNVSGIIKTMQCGS